MNYARFLNSLSQARQPSPIRVLSKCLLGYINYNLRKTAEANKGHSAKIQMWSRSWGFEEEWETTVNIRANHLKTNRIIKDIVLKKLNEVGPKL